MSKHTPGPWIVDEPHQVYAEAVHEYVAITQVEDWETVPREQVEANARLIAAAPDLLEALGKMVAVYSGQVQNDGGYTVLDSVRPLITDQAAIKQAEENT